MASSNQDILDAMESIAREAPAELLKQYGMQELAIVSAAISLKRIADFLDEELRYNPTSVNLFDRLTSKS